MWYVMCLRNDYFYVVALSAPSFGWMSLLLQDNVIDDVKCQDEFMKCEKMSQVFAEF